MYTMVGWILVDLFARVPDVIARYTHLTTRSGTKLRPETLLGFDVMLPLSLLLSLLSSFVVVLRRPRRMRISFGMY